MSPTEQRLIALELANQHRIGAAHLRAELAAGLIGVQEALEDPRAQCMPIGRLLCAKQHWGPQKTNRLMNVLRIFPTRRVRDLTDRQKRIIAERTGR